MSTPEYFQHRRAERLAAGLCVACGQAEHEHDRTRCAACLEAARRNTAQRRARAAAKGLCDACLRRKRKAGRGGRCGLCADFYLARQLKRERAQRRAS